MKITITLPNPAKAWRENRKVKLTRNQAMYVSFCLERLRLGYQDGGTLSNQEIRNFEDIIDSQVWGSKYVANRTLVNQALAMEGK